MYEWKLNPDRVTEVTSHLTNLAQQKTSQFGTEYMSEDSLYCKAHISEGPLTSKRCGLKTPVIQNNGP